MAQIKFRPQNFPFNKQTSIDRALNVFNTTFTQEKIVTV